MKDCIYMREVGQTMKKLISLCLMLTLGVLLTACQAAKADETVMAAYLENLKAGSFEAASAQLETVPENFQYGENDIMKAFFAKLSYEVKDAKADGSQTAVTLFVSLPDTAAIYDDMMNNIGEEVQKLQKGDDASKTKASDLMVDFMLAKISSEDVKMAENTVEVILKVVDGKTVIVPNDELSKALSGIPSSAK